MGAQRVLLQKRRFAGFALGGKLGKFRLAVYAEHLVDVCVGISGAAKNFRPRLVPFIGGVFLLIADGIEFQKDIVVLGGEVVVQPCKETYRILTGGFSV